MRKQNIYLHALDSKVLFPYNEFIFTLKANSYESQTFENLIGFVTNLDGKDHKDIERIDSVSAYGTLLRVQKTLDITKSLIVEKNKDSNTNYVGLTFARFKILALKREDSRMIGHIEIYADEVPKEVEASLEKKGLLQKLRKQLQVYYDFLLKTRENEFDREKFDSQASVWKLLYKGINDIELPFLEKLKFLQLNRLDTRIEILTKYLIDKTEKSKGIISIQSKVKDEMTKKKKPAFDSKYIESPDKNELTNKIKNKKMPENVRLEIEKQMKNMGYGTDKAVSQRYIETLLEIPWMEGTNQVKDIEFAEKILNDDHTGLKDVKERILEFLAVKFRNGNSKGNVICLHGPPGVGKTSIAKSIAKSLGREFTRVSLGGMNDESQLRGHRRTYVAALPGVIIRSLIKGKSNNPVILLDQIQKMGKSYKGNPEHALLQILDPSQNSSFVDHYVAFPVDLSKVMFICTANSLELSTPLLNRLELIQVPGYSRQEKLQIAKNHLIPTQLKENGVQGLVQFQKDGVREVIKYSKEMGVRELQRNLSKICRKVARKNVKEIITPERVEEYLGKRYKNDLWSGVGIVNGMAWTQLGGKVLTVEAIQYRSDKQKIQITGQLGEVMKQSVNIAFSWIKSNFQDLAFVSNIASHVSNVERSKIFEDSSIHIHFPEGAVKKDGPSAGVAIVTCITSLLLKVPPRENLSMTGEITLSGKVLPVGGIRQKCIAAIYQGMKHIIIPFDNAKDLEKIDEQMRKSINFYPVKDIKEVLSVAFPGIMEKYAPKL